MKSYKRILLFLWVIVLISVISLPQNLIAGAWTQKKGGIYNESLFTYYTTRSEFDKHYKRNSLSNGGRFSKQEFQEYIEYGITHRITAIGNFGYDIIHYKDNNGDKTNNGFIGNELALRYKIQDFPFILSAQGLISIPPTFSETGSLPVTNGQIDLEPRILVGKSFDKIKTYFNLENAIRFRLEGPADEWRLHFALGYKGFYPWETIFEYSHIIGFNNGTRQIVNENITITTDYDLYRLAWTSLIHMNKHLAVKIQPFVHVAGENTGNGWGITSGLVLNFD